MHDTTPKDIANSARSHIDRLTAEQFESVMVSPLEVLLDPSNPRIPSCAHQTTRGALLGELADGFRLDDLGRSIASRGFLNFDPILCYRKEEQIFVKEGNRRIAALHLLLEPERSPQRQRGLWKTLSESASAVRDTFEKIRIFVVDDPDDPDLLAYIGFRHVSGALKWSSHEKAAYISHLVDRGMDYSAAGRQLGSRRDAVERHYVAQKVIETAREAKMPGTRRAQRNFGVLLRALNAPGTRKFIGVEYNNDPDAGRAPVPPACIDNLANFLRWTFGTEDGRTAVLQDSRQLTAWGRILSNKAAVEYLANAESPTFESALQRCDTGPATLEDESQDFTTE